MPLIVDVDIENAQSVIQQLLDSKAADYYRQFYQYFRQVTLNRLQYASANTEYATASLGSKQPFTKRVRGVDAEYGIDSQTFLEAISGPNSVRVVQGEFVIETDLEYAERLNSLFALKGPWDEGVLFFDELDVKKLEQIIARTLT